MNAAVFVPLFHPDCIAQIGEPFPKVPMDRAITPKSWNTPRKRHPHTVPERHLRQNTCPGITELFSLPGTGAVCLHAGGIPIGLYDPARSNMRKIIEKPDLTISPFSAKITLDTVIPSR